MWHQSINNAPYQCKNIYHGSNLIPLTPSTQLSHKPTLNYVGALKTVMGYPGMTWQSAGRTYVNSTLRDTTATSVGWGLIVTGSKTWVSTTVGLKHLSTFMLLCGITQKHSSSWDQVMADWIPYNICPITGPTSTSSMAAQAPKLPYTTNPWWGLPPHQWDIQWQVSHMQD